MRSRPRWDGGYSTVEAVVTLPAVIFLTMLVVQYALLWHGRHGAEAAAQDGLRAARAYQASAATGQAAAARYLAQVAPNLLTAPTVEAVRTPATASVDVRAQVLSVLPLATFAVSAHAAGPVEHFVP
jgi:hypothetical protein